MKFQFLNTAVLSEEIFQNAVLRITTGNISKKKSRERLIEEHKKLEYFGDKNEYVIHNTCSQPDLNLNQQLRVSIANLQIDRILPIEKFLLCRVITRFTKINALLTLVEDPEGNVERLALYNWTIAADNNTIIYSNNPEDVVIYDHNDKLFDDLKWSTDLLNDKEIKEKTADDFYCYGDDDFVSNDYTAAVDEYSNGIKLEPQNVTLYADRAEAFLRLSQFRNALDDVDIVLKYEPGHLKAAFHRGKALCDLKRYQESITTLQDLHQRMKIITDHRIAPIKQSTEQLLKHVKILASENKNGQYDYTHIINEFCESAKIRKGPRLDHADFLFEDIEIRPVEGKGRGWIAKCDIPENTLLMVSKAFSIVYSHEVLGRRDRKRFD
ncbi:hypothetical protein RhiirA5_438059 [Rhizophagus irregularis]|uniref:Uncharacterized protein n=1 Tax=Rhizophagus irregularis TaxID=588596 RepID=A0A2N0NJN3_9GLOM|nr:hypothetical protein RhiirA5_438059 [Rhizophagus irregularis]